MFVSINGTWNYLFYDHGKRRSKLIGTKRQYPTKAAAWKAVEPTSAKPAGNGAAVMEVSTRYQAERMPTRLSTARVYRSFLDNHASIKTTMDIYGDVVTDEMSTASRKVAEIAFPLNGAQTECKAS